MTRHSIVRLPGRWASNETATRREVTDVRATGVQSSDGTVKEIVLGVDTHLDIHVVVALDALGRHLGESKIPTTLSGYGQLLAWAQGFGVVRCAGVEGTSS